MLAIRASLAKEQLRIQYLPASQQVVLQLQSDEQRAVLHWLFPRQEPNESADADDNTQPRVAYR